MRSFTAKWLGVEVAWFISQDCPVDVLGVTSKGVFLQNASREVVFVSGEVFRGPLTINLHELLDFKALYTVGERCQISNGWLTFPGCKVLLGSASVWEPPLIIFTKDGAHFAFHRGIELAGELIGDYDDGLFFPFIDALIDQPNAEKNENLWDLIPNLNDGQTEHMLEGLLGFGGGLTPAGDDFICGFLLAKFYLGNLDDFSKIPLIDTDNIVTLAKSKTTALSASLIRCAVQGKADERVLNALRWIAAGQGEIEEIKKELLSYGSSSGVDTIAGMLAALLAQDA